MQDFYRYDLGCEEDARKNIKKICQKLMHDMHYEARIQAMVQLYALHRNMKVKKRMR